MPAESSLVLCRLHLLLQSCKYRQANAKKVETRFRGHKLGMFFLRTFPCGFALFSEKFSASICRVGVQWTLLFRLVSNLMVFMPYFSIFIAYTAGLLIFDCPKSVGIFLADLSRTFLTVLGDMQMKFTSNLYIAKRT